MTAKTAVRNLLESSRSRRWTALIDRIAKGDLNACGAFYDESSVLAFSLIMQIVQDRDVAEDLLVELYVDIRARAQRGEHRDRNPLPWLIALARSIALSRFSPYPSRSAMNRIVPFQAAG